MYLEKMPLMHPTTCIGSVPVRKSLGNENERHAAGSMTLGLTYFAMKDREREKDRVIYGGVFSIVAVVP